MQFFPRDHLAGMFDENGQDLKGLPRKPQPDPVFAQLSRANIYFKHAEAADRWKLLYIGHKDSGSECVSHKYGFGRWALMLCGMRASGCVSNRVWKGARQG